MRRQLLLLTLALAGCGEPATPTLHEKYLAAAAAFDRENAKLTRLANATKNAELKSLAVYNFFRLAESLPHPGQLPMYQPSGKGRGAQDSLVIFQYYEALQDVVAARRQVKIIEPLRTQANQSRAAWIASTRGE